MASAGPHVLLTWRGSDPSPPAPFSEAYYCVTCGDYFSLVFAPDSQPRAPSVTVLATSNGPPEPTAVHCPGCRASYPEYGAIGEAALAAERPAVDELLVTTFPPNAPRSRQVRVGELVVERFVLLLAGPLPPPDLLAEFAAKASASMIELIIKAPVRGGAVPLHVLAVSTLADDTPWLSALLDTHVYRGALGSRVFGSLGPLEAPSGTRALLCAVGTAPSPRLR